MDSAQSLPEELRWSDKIASGAPLKTPILLLIFNRPESTQLVFDAIRKSRPQRLFVKADGPRAHKPGEAELCAQARDIVRQVDWECDANYSFEEANAGCRSTVCNGIDWFFRNVDDGIILEDDCLPTQSFFWFCQELLARYRDDKRIMQISGNNYLMGGKRHAESYYFSKLADISGWATWRRAWSLFDLKMPGFPEFEANDGMMKYLGHRRCARWLMSYLRDAHRNPKGIWSPAWVYAMARNEGLVIVPNVNLVDHLGYGKNDSTFSSGGTWDIYNSVVKEDLAMMIHPSSVVRDVEADAIRFGVIVRTDPRLILKERLKKWWRWKVVESARVLLGRVAAVWRRLRGC